MLEINIWNENVCNEVWLSSLRVIICRPLCNVIPRAPVTTRSDIVLNGWIGWMLDALAGPQMCIPYITKLV